MKRIMIVSVVVVCIAILSVVMFLACNNDRQNKSSVPGKETVIDPALNQYIRDYISFFGNKRQYLVFQLFCTGNNVHQKQFLLTSQVSLKKLLQFPPSGYLEVSGEAVLTYSGFESLIETENAFDRRWFLHKILIWDEDLYWKNCKNALHSPYNFTHPSWILEYDCLSKKWSRDPGYDTLIYNKKVHPSEKVLFQKVK